MTNPDWITSFITPVRDLDGYPAQLIAGVVSTGAGRQVAVHISAAGSTAVVLRQQAAAEHIKNLDAARTLKARLDAEDGRP